MIGTILLTLGVVGIVYFAAKFSIEDCSLKQRREIEEEMEKERDRLRLSGQQRRHKT